MKEYDPFKYVETNINGALRILEYAERIMQTGLYILRHGQSRQDIGEKKMFFILSIQENCCLPVIIAFYAITKSMIVDTMEYYKQEYGLKNFVFRLLMCICIIRKSIIM